MHIVRVGLIMTLHLIHFPHLPHHTSLQNGEDTGDSCLTGPTAFCTSDFSASWLSPTLSVAPLNLLCSCLLLSTSPHKGVQAQTLKFFFSPRRLIHSHHLNTIKRLKRSQCMSPALTFTSFTSADATACVTSPLHTVQLRTPAPSLQPDPPQMLFTLTRSQGPVNSTPPHQSACL